MPAAPWENPVRFRRVGSADAFQEWPHVDFSTARRSLRAIRSQAPTNPGCSKRSLSISKPTIVPALPYRISDSQFSSFSRVQRRAKCDAAPERLSSPRTLAMRAAASAIPTQPVKSPGRAARGTASRRDNACLIPPIATRRTSEFPVTACSSARNNATPLVPPYRSGPMVARSPYERGTTLSSTFRYPSQLQRSSCHKACCASLLPIRDATSK